MPTLAYFGINSSGLNLAIDLLILFLVVLYLSLVYWTYADARRRIVDPMLIGCATAASLFPYVGTVVYIILRPPEYLEDVRERELEMQAAEVRLAALEQNLCPHCDYQVERDFLRCPSCMRKLKEPCQSCGKPLERTWSLCPYCEADVPGASQSRRAARKRGERSGSSAPLPTAGADIDSEAQTGESDVLLGEETLARSTGGGSAAGKGAGSDKTHTPMSASKPSPAAGATPRASRPRPSS
ncbi:MAG TPA: zinc ribbon domain-containing protein [Solirubrobacteraceae bacterium]|jgi:hypothetical protein|nr:zinc ribbon domain-containing protein [Solirubrobacteraceae bacterium]